MFGYYGGLPIRFGLHPVNILVNHKKEVTYQPGVACPLVTHRIAKVILRP